MTELAQAPRKVTQHDRPCEVHKYHSPITVINELHHIFPQEKQKRVWGEVRDNREVSLCGTGHNTVTQSWLYHDKHLEWPEWCIGESRLICNLGWDRYVAACKEAGIEP